MAVSTLSPSIRPATTPTTRATATEYRPLERLLRSFRRKSPTVYHKCLAVHMLQAEQFSALR
jgi:hypothetical protein